MLSQTKVLSIPDQVLQTNPTAPDCFIPPVNLSEDRFQVTVNTIIAVNLQTSGLCSQPGSNERLPVSVLEAFPRWLC